MLKFFIRKKNQGIVSIFLLIVLLPTMIFSTMLMEIGRYKSAKNLLEESAQNAATSILADYNKVLYDKFGLFAFDDQDEEKLKDNFVNYLKANCQTVPTENEYAVAASKLMKLTKNVNIDTFYSLRTNNVLLRQIQEYSKYRAPADLCEYAINFEKIKKDVLKELGKKIFGAQMYNTVQTSIKQLSACIDFISKTKDFMYTIMDLEGSIEGYNIFENAADKWRDIKKFFEKEEIPAKGTSYKKAQKNLIDAIRKRDEIVNKLKSKEQQIAAIIQVAKNIKEYLETNTQTEITGITNLNDIIAGYTGIDCLNLQENATIEDWFNLVKDSKYEFKNIGESFTVDEIENIISNEKSLLGKKNTKELDKAINKLMDCHQEYIKSIGNVKDKMVAYQTQVKELGDTVSKLAGDLGSEQGDICQAILEAINEAFQGGFQKYINKVDGGLKLCESKSKEIQEKTVDNILESDVTIPTVNELKEYHMSYTDAGTLAVAINGLKLGKMLADTSPIVKVIKGLKKIRNTLTPVPYRSVPGKKVILSQQTLQRNNSRNVDDNENRLKDMNNKTKLLEDAKKYVPSEYLADIDRLSEEDSLNDDALYEQIMQKMDNLYEGVYDLISRNSNHDPIMILMPGTNVNVVKVLLNLKPIINDVKNIYDSVVWLAKLVINGQGKVVLEALGDGIGDKLLTSYYIRDKATTRLDDVRNDNYTDAQIFNSCNLEYVLYGNPSETVNQEKVFGRILVLRMLSNMITMLMDENCMKIISSCSIFAPLVFLAWNYYEANVDMNLLVRVETEVPLIKKHLVLSIETLEDPEGTLLAYIQNICDDAMGNEKKKENKKKTENFLQDSKGTPFWDWSYKDYLLLFLILLPQGRSLQRMGDVIQMEVRYEERKKKGKATFELSKANTYLRSDVTADLNPLLPVKSMSGGNFSIDLFKMNEVTYNGY